MLRQTEGFQMPKSTPQKEFVAGDVRWERWSVRAPFTLWAGTLLKEFHPSVDVVADLNAQL